MKKTILFLLLLALLSVISGLLMADMSWIGRVGVNLLHKEYKFMKVWWQGALVVYGVVLSLFIIHSVIHKRFGAIVSRIIHFLLLLCAAGLLYLAYADFEDDFSHKLMKEHFHLGVYIVPVCWMMICVFFISKRKASAATINADSKATVAP